MTIALELHRTHQPHRSASWVQQLTHKPITAWIKRLFWHTHAYATIFGIMVLTCLGMVLLSGYEAVRARKRGTLIPHRSSR